MESQPDRQRSVDNRYAVSRATVDAANAASAAAVERFSTNHPYAGFWRRAGAYAIDYILVTFTAGIAGALLAGIIGRLMPLAVLVGVWFYYALMESSDQQATLGKRVVGIKVTDLEGNQISFGRATGRLAAHILSGLILGIGFAMAVFTSRRQTLHDKIAGTLVVKREWTEEEVAAAGAAPPVPAWASVLIVLAVVVFGPFGIGMIAAISIPAYQEYTIRTQVMDGLADAEPYKAVVADAIAKGRSLADVDFPALDTGAPKSNFVMSVRVVSGAIAIDYGRAANRLIAGKELVLVPGLSGGRELVWVCGHAPPPEGLTMPIGNYAKLTGIPDKYLPIACRGIR
jgi:uncharacterized RDD family membrane protein YckC/Tfp pilus assembly major pilin PilA